MAVASLLAVGAIYARLATRETQAAIAQQLKSLTGVVANSSFPLTDAVLKQMKGLSGAEFVVMSAEGDVISASQLGLDKGLPTVLDSSAEGRVALGPPIMVADSTYFHTVLPLRRQQGETEVLHILFPQQRYNEAWRSAFVPPFVVGGVTVVVLALVTQWIASRISHNLTTLGVGVQRLAEGEFKPLAIPPRDDELRDLTLAVNQTAHRLADYEQHVRQTEQMRTVAMLGAGLAHEMRNAATGCRLAVDLHAEGCRAAPDDDSLAVAKSQLQLMENRLQGFLQLGRDQTSIEPQELDLTDLVNELVPLVLPAARHAGVKVDLSARQDPLIVRGQRESLGMVIVNLLLNAIEAAQKTPPPHGVASVSISLTQDSRGYAELAVSDSGPGLSSELAQRLFQPFVTTKPEGVGLGLAVARQVAESHGGDLSWSRVDDCTRFRLRLPVAPNEVITEGNGCHAKNSGC